MSRAGRAVVRSINPSGVSLVSSFSAKARSMAVASALACLTAVVLAPVNARAADYRYDLVSMPDFLNADVGDNTVSPFWKPGDPASSNEIIETALTEVIREVAAAPGDDLLVAGDLIYGHWYADPMGVQLFGPINTDAEKDQAMTVAANIFYSQWLQRFAPYGLTVHAAVGDHEIGDNPWRRPQDAYKRSRKPLFEDLWAQYFTANGTRYPLAFDSTNYAVQLHPEVMLVTLNLFSQRGGVVHTQVKRPLLRWLDSTLTQADKSGVDWVIVQGHTPIVGPVRSRNSSDLHYEGGSQSPLWRTLVEHKVDAYLCGEVHTVSMVRQDGVTQICHGGLALKGDANYLTASFGPRALNIQTHEWLSTTDLSSSIWQTDRSRPYSVVYQPGSYVTGTLRQTASGRLTQQNGALREYVSVRQW